MLAQLGCTPNATTYYRPSMPGGQVLAGRCVPTESAVAFGALPMEARVVEGQIGWFVVLSLPSRRPAQLAWRTFHFAAADFRVRDPASGITTPALPINVLRDDRRDSVVEPYSPAQGAGWLYSVDVRLAGPPPERFELLLPPVVIDGAQVRYAPILFERKVWVGASPFNC
ncbi:MAG: hypothetical protein KGL68_12640 [Burkholderiales bacterium]|nr:hypothetical protein [Burkholderiales bacterium]